VTVHWTAGNAFTLLENGEQFFPRVFERIAQAKTEILLETFILFDDKVGQALRSALIDASRRGVSVHVLVDGYGTADLPTEFVEGLTEAGVGFHIFDPGRAVWGMRLNFFRRMHRKLIVIDGALGFVGGINFGYDHLAEFGPLAKQDYAVEVIGPIVGDIQAFMRCALAPVRRKQRWRRRDRRLRSSDMDTEGTASAALVIRDNDRHTTDIEQHYRMAIRRADHEVVLANAYFFPGYRLLRALRVAASRGVKVMLILQGRPDLPVTKLAASMLYDYLLSAGVEIYEYGERPFHGKVATFDSEWATVGSSNLDPLSLALNLEANVMIRDEGFNRELRSALQRLVDNHCTQIKPSHRPRRKIYRTWLGVIIFHFLRRFPYWVKWLPAHKVTLISATPRHDDMSVEHSDGR
jgi:cardiolipin synthase